MESSLFLSELSKTHSQILLNTACSGLARKIKAGVDFIQTQAVFDVAKFNRWMKMVKDQGLDEQVHILAGIIPVRSAGMARYMRDYVSGVTVPEKWLPGWSRQQTLKKRV